MELQSQEDCMGAFAFVGDIEPFKDETIDLVEKLKQAGMPVSFALYEDCYHAFEMVVPRAAISCEARRFLLPML